MAKATPKTVAKKAAKKPAKKTVSASKVKSVSLSIEKSCEDALQNLKSLNLDAQLQADLEWCLGSYKADNNPAGLYEMAERALNVFTVAKEKKTKGVTAKLIGDLEKVLKSRP
ncbi:MAG: hypothetical protein OEV74_14435 [Cyclobacteriaceae bacterium]|jgi:hypothetical protein|nr:hypothetical protein [Cyclobacteriaceae bacterium]MDH4297479.1 hypothetical protein [Cyclobacteriaceae bacterium]MDH5247789.1 hypothetical protein [Cyclobacteriaceae bacterium]